MPTVIGASNGSLEEILETGEIEVEGRLLDASNLVLRVWVSRDNERIPAVYKPIRGERPLWDFPDGSLAARERAAYLVSEAAGWGIVPPTALREGPFGEGSVQLWVGDLGGHADDDVVDLSAPADLDDDRLPVLSLEGEDGSPLVLTHPDSDEVRTVVLFDTVANNADRKGSAMVLTAERLWSIDQGLCFHAQDKLRTVLWGFAGQPLKDREIAALERLGAALEHDLERQLSDLLSPSEIAAAQLRVTQLLTMGVLPGPPAHRHPLPWPLW